jgi:RNA polymerase sigma-70 factor (ECF subfamily)
MIAMSGSSHVLTQFGLPSDIDGDASSVLVSEATSTSAQTDLPDAHGPDDRGLLQRVALGDAQAFWELWTRHRGWLFEVCNAYMGYRHEDAEDALGDVMDRARETLPREAPRIRNFAAWLRRMAVNVCIDLYRRDRSRYQILSVARATSTAQLSDVQSVECVSPASEFLASETRGTVTRAIETLPVRLRAAACLFFLEEASYPAIAAVLGISEQNSRKRIQEARSILKEQLDAKFPERRRSRAVARGTADQRPEVASRRKLEDAIDRGPRVSAQRTLAAQIHESAGVTAERKRLDAMFGVGGQREHTKEPGIPDQPQATW